MSARKIIIMVSLWLLVATAPQDVSAQTAAQTEAEPPFRMAILNLGAIRRQSVAVNDIRSQINNYRKGFQADIQKEEDALRTANQELAKKRTILSPEAFAKERRLFEQKVVEVQKLVQRRKFDLDQAQAKAMVEVEKKLNGIIADVAQARGVSVVMRRNQTILVARSLDITDVVLKRLNAELTKVPVAQPGKK